MAMPQGAFYVELGRRVREARKKHKGLTQDKLARAVGLQRTSITNIECGRQPLAVDVFVRLASVLGCAPADLLPVRGDSVADRVRSKIGSLEPDKQQWVTQIMKPNASLTPSV
jgi:transcriptional regulator with XRE-family HTH domain